MLAQLKLELPPLPPLPLDLLLKLFTSSSLPFPAWDAPRSSAKSPPGVSSVGKGGWLGEDTSGGLTPALLTLSRCLKDGLTSSAVVFLTGGVPYMLTQSHDDTQENSTRKTGDTKKRHRKNSQNNSTLEGCFGGFCHIMNSRSVRKLGVY